MVEFLRVFCVAAAICLLAGGPTRADVDVVIGYLEQVVPPPPVLSNLQGVPEDQGLSGAKLAVDDNSTTGRFLKHRYTLETTVVEPDGDLLAAARDLLAKTRLLIVNAPQDALLAIADLPEARDAVLFNAGTRDTSLRDKDCRANVLHTLPSRAMLADALAQFAVKKRWTRWVLVSGGRDGDKAMAAALKAAAAKFRLKLVSEKQWTFDADMRRSAAAEVPLFTQDFDDHHLMVIADEHGDFSRYVAYHTWLARPVAGSEGLVPAAWSPVVEQFGAAQLQNRFKKQANRPMRPVDYAAWVAGRAIGEAVTRTNSGDIDGIRAYLFSKKFQLAGFKGRSLSFRSWNGQLRQPIPLSHSRALVALAPIEGFLHQHNELDSLGIDKPQSRCTAFGE